MIAPQMYTPYAMNLGRLVNLDKKGRFIGQPALRVEQARGPARQIVGLAIDWNEVEKLYDEAGLAPTVAATASRVAVPVYRNGRQIGKATSTTWSPVLKRMIALATIERGHYEEGTKVLIEVTVEAVRHRVTATVTRTPFFNPPRKLATPPA
jgi:aminomethyltransferase